MKKEKKYDPGDLSHFDLNQLNTKDKDLDKLITTQAYDYVDHLFQSPESLRDMDFNDLNSLSYWIYEQKHHNNCLIEKNEALLDWADNLEDVLPLTPPDKMYERIMANISEKHKAYELEKEKQKRKKKLKGFRKSIRRILPLVAMLTLFFSLFALQAGMLSFESLYTFRATSIRGLTGEKNPYGVKDTPDIMAQYEETYKKVGFNFLVPYYVPVGYKLTSIKIFEPLDSIILQFSNGIDFFTIKETKLQEEQLTINNLLTTENIIASKEFNWNGFPSMLYTMSQESGNQFYMIMQNYNNINIKLTCTLPENETLELFKILLPYKN